MNISQYKANLQWTGIGVILATAVLSAITIVVLDDINDLVTRMLLTAFVIGYYTLMPAVSFGEHRALKILATLALILAIGGLVVTVSTIWASLWWKVKDEVVKTIVTFAVLSFATAHVATNIRHAGQSAFAGLVQGVAHSCVALLTAMVLYLVWHIEGNIPDGFGRGLAAVAIVNVAFTGVNLLIGWTEPKQAST